MTTVKWWSSANACSYEEVYWVAQHTICSDAKLSPVLSFGCDQPETMWNPRIPSLDVQCSVLMKNEAPIPVQSELLKVI